jgi:hypothetical protein
MLGPALQAVGLGWEALHILLRHWDTPLSARHLFYEPGVLLIIVGFVVAAICAPVALEVALADEAELEIPLYDPEATAGTLGPPASRRFSEAELRARERAAGRGHPATDQDQLPRLRS